ncbi:MAG: selenium metabolism-associated LysR family transcriptional regulator [Clostridiaceae bacterium]|jgi:DNA-binding transcriptional LysR family regulator|nr:selenium metabolism-associated LysR family transcriptional regulator [Clostridiaceae bacterium]
MDFRQIEAFVYVVRFKSFSKAADAIYLTQPTISSHISTLEKELGIKLIDRSGKGVEPTNAGKIFFDFANNLINIRDNALFTLNEFSRKVEGKVEIAASTVPAEYLLPKLMIGFREIYGDISFSVDQFDSKQVIDELLDKKYELGMVGTVIEDNKLEYQKLMDDKLVLAAPCSEKFCAIASNILPFEAIKNESFIYRESGSGTRQEFEKIFMKHGIDPSSIRIAARFNSIDAIKQAVSQGLGVSIMSYVSIEDYIKFGRIKAFDIEGIDLTRAFYIVTHKKRPFSPVNSVFLKYVIDSYKVPGTNKLI